MWHFVRLCYIKTVIIILSHILFVQVVQGVGMLACQIVGSVVPVANDVLLSYKQHRLERNVLNSLKII